MTPNAIPTALAERASNGYSSSVQDYCKAIHALGEGGAHLVSTSAIAAKLHVSAGSASAMLRNLNQLGLVRHTPYRGARLTTTGEKVALETIRNHRLIELFLHDVMGMSWDEVHSEAEVLEHVVSDRLKELIALMLGDPKFDPHGDPIPDRDGIVVEVDADPLANVEIGRSGRIVRVSDADPELLRALTDMGVARGDDVEIRARDPFGGLTHIRVAGRAPDLPVPMGMAEAIQVKLDPMPRGAA